IRPAALRHLPGRTQRLIRIAQHRLLAERRHFQRKVGAAHPRPADRTEERNRRAFLHGARLEACDLRLAPPRLAFLEPTRLARGEADENEGADEIPTNSGRHSGTMRGSLLTTLQ